MKMHHFSLFAAMVLTFAVTGPPAMAQTPDGSTPAVEGICDTLKADGISKGLYGLCVAYCEAQDFSSETVPLTDEEILALVEAGAPSGKILENYNKRRTAADPEMPCVVRKPEACPCWTAAEVQAMDGIRDDDGQQVARTECILRPPGSRVPLARVRETDDIRAGELSPYGKELYTQLGRGGLTRGDLCWYRDTSSGPAARYIYGLTPEEVSSCITSAAAAPICPQ